MNKIYAISDVHGCYDTFVKCLQEINFDLSDTLYLLGDYIDRGPKSMSIIDKIIDMQNNGYNVQCITGNHEQMMLNSFDNPSESQVWLWSGGSSVMEELGLIDVRQIPIKYINFIRNLKYYIETDDYLFVHAAINLHKLDPFSDLDYMIWERNWYNEELFKEHFENKKVIHGHTPQTQNVIVKKFQLFTQDYHPVLNIDNGCVFKREGFNNLCCVNLTDNKLHFIKNIDVYDY